MAKRSPTIQATPAEQALFLSDKCCCVCHNRVVGVQVHHLDGDESNNEPDNLAVLCTHHHDEATRTGGLTRKLSEGLIRLYREHWHAVVRARREREASSAPAPKRGKRITASPEANRPAKVLLDALAIHEVRKIECELRQDPEDWLRSLRLIKPLVFYAERYDVSVGQSILSAVDVLVSRAHHTMDALAASEISSVIYTALPLPNLLSPESRRRSATELRVIDAGAALGFELAYRSIKKRRTNSLGVVDAGIDILWAVLRYATLNRNAKLSSRVSEYFDYLERVANERAFPDAARWVAYLRADALDLAQEGPPPPDDLEEKIWAEMAAARSHALNPVSG